MCVVRGVSGSMSTPPIATKYARFPDDMRLVREWLRVLGRDCSALYVGPAWGDDLWSWLNVDIGTGSALNWTAVEIDRDAASKTALYAASRVVVIHSDAMEHFGRYDLIVANNCWSVEPNDNQALFYHLLNMTDGILFARGSQVSPAKVATFRHYSEPPDAPAEIFAMRSVPMAEIVKSEFVNIERVA